MNALAPSLDSFLALCIFVSSLFKMMYVTSSSLRRHCSIVIPTVLLLHIDVSTWD